SRLDNLAKINEKTTTINEQMALLRAAEADLRKQREMIEGLIARVSAHADLGSHADEAPAQPLHLPQSQADVMQTTKLATFEAPRPPAAPAAAPAAPAAPLVSDDLMAEIGSAKPAFDPMKTQKLPP